MFGFPELRLESFSGGKRGELAMCREKSKKKCPCSKKKKRKLCREDKRVKAREPFFAPLASCVCPDPCDGILRAGDCCIPYSSVACRNPFNLRLAGLNQNLNFQLFRMEGCKVSIEYECQGSNDEVVGTVCGIGTDYIGVRKANGVVSTILKERICKIEWKDSCCNPCGCRGRHDCDCGGEGNGRCDDCDCGCHDGAHHT